MRATDRRLGMPTTQFGDLTRCGWRSEHTAAPRLRGRFSIFSFPGELTGRTQVGGSLHQNGGVVQSPWRTWRTWRGTLIKFRISRGECRMTVPAVNWYLKAPR